MAIRLNFIVEGQTEEAFVNTILRPHLDEFSVWSKARCVMTSRKGNVKHRGGVINYALAKNDITRWLREDSNHDVRFTTMFDLYALPSDFPGHTDAVQVPNPYERIKILEQALQKDIGDSRFIPYLQLHEFEALLLSDPRKLDDQFPDYAAAIDRITDLVSQFDSPELVNSGDSTAPSKRIIAEIPEYQGRKASAGPIITGRIGLPALRMRCAHFEKWLARLERLGTDS